LPSGRLRTMQNANKKYQGRGNVFNFLIFKTLGVFWKMTFLFCSICEKTDSNYISSAPNSVILGQGSAQTPLDRLLDWGLMAFSAQIGYIVPLISMTQFKKAKLMRKLTILRVGNTYNKPVQ